MNKLGLNPLALALMLALTACGGGGGGSDSTGGDPAGGDNTGGENPRSVSLTGLAVKGILKNADITVTSLDGTTTYGTTTTNALGQYSLEQMDIPADVPIKVTMTTNTSTEVKCDAADGCNWDGRSYTFGQFYFYNNPDFKLTAILPSYGEATSKTLMVTPVTHLAATRTEASYPGGASAAEVTAVAKATATLLGLDNIDITNTSPADITDSASATADIDSQKYGAVVAAIATVATQKNTDIANVVNSLAADYEDGGLVGNSSSDDTVDLEDIFAGASASAATATSLGNLGTEGATIAAEYQADSLIASQEEQDQEQTAEVIVDEQPLTQEQAVANAISLLEDLNTWDDAITSVDGETLVTAMNTEADETQALVAAMENKVDIFRGFQELVVANDDMGNEVPGVVFQATDVMLQAASMGAYIVENHENIPATGNNTDGYTVSAKDLLDSGVELSILDFLDDDGDGLVDEGLGVTATFFTSTLGSETYVSSISFSGEGLGATIEDGSEMTVAVTIDGTMTAKITGFNMTGTDNGEVFSGSGEIEAVFDSLAAMQEFIANEDVSGLVSLNVDLDSSVTGISTLVGDADFSQATASLITSFSASRASATAAEISGSLNMGIALSNTDGDEINGTMTATTAGSLADASNLDSLFTVDSSSISFAGVLQVTDVDSNVLSYKGSVGFSPILVDGSNVGGTLELDGMAKLQKASGYYNSFEGSLSIREEMILDANGKIVPSYYNYSFLTEEQYWQLASQTEDWRLPLLVPTKFTLAGGLTVVNATGEHSVGLSGSMVVNNLQEIAALVGFENDPTEIDYGTVLDTITFTDVDVSYNSADNTVAMTLVTDYDLAGFSSLVASFADYGWDVDGALWRTYWPAVDSVISLSCDDLATVCEVYSLTGGDDYAAYMGSFYPDSIDVTDPASWWPEALPFISYRFDTSIYVEDPTGVAGWVYGAGYVSPSDLLAGSSTTVELYADGYWPSEVVDRVLDVESMESYLEFSVALQADVTLPGVDQASMRLVGERSGLDDGVGLLRLSYGDRRITLNVNSEQLEVGSVTNLTITNGDVSMVIAATCAGGDNNGEKITQCTGDLEFAGTISSGGYQVGTLEVRNGIPVFVFNDGSQYNLVVTPEFLISLAN